MRSTVANAIRAAFIAVFLAMVAVAVTVREVYRTFRDADRD